MILSYYFREKRDALRYSSLLEYYNSTIIETEDVNIRL